jgi:hypothetical protein
LGTYHFMGLGLSVGAVTAPVSYLAMRYRRWNEADRAFFGASGERAQRERGEKVGDVQAIVLVTTPEVFEGTQEQFHSLPYNDNAPGRRPQSGAKLEPRAPMREALRALLPLEWAPIARGRTEVPLYWCLVDRTALLPTFQRVAEVLLAARSTGALGKEVWINLTGGNNVLNLALQLAATLTGQPARFYYVQAADRTEESCLCYPREEGYWVDLPLLPVVPNEAGRTLARLTAELGEVKIGELLQYAQADERQWKLFQNVPNLDHFVEHYVRPLDQQGLLERDGDSVRVGRAWSLLQPYYETLDSIEQPHDHLGRLTQEAWFHEETLELP